MGRRTTMTPKETCRFAGELRIVKAGIRHS
jgi:hypothetical protein